MVNLIVDLRYGVIDPETEDAMIGRSGMTRISVALAHPALTKSQRVSLVRRGSRDEKRVAADHSCRLAGAPRPPTPARWIGGRL